jgi:hypothetical protein
MDKQVPNQNLNPNTPKIIPPNPDNELTAGQPVPVMPPATPTTSPAVPVSPDQATEKKLEDMLAEAERKAGSVPPLGAPAKRKRRRWLVWLIVILLLIGGAAAWYFLMYKPQQQATAPAAVVTQRNATLVYRSSTFPTASLTVRGSSATLTVRTLNPLADAPYALVLVKNSGAVLPTAPRLDDPQALALGNFEINTEGQVVSDKNQNNTFPVSQAISNYDTALVVVNSSNSKVSVIMSGKLSQDPRDPTSTTANLAFPVDLSNLSGSLQIKTLQSGKQELEVNFNSLPDVAALSYAYEAHLVKFEGPYVTKDEAIGRFPGNQVGVAVNLPIQDDLGSFTNLVISLEPSWDTNKDISQIKPFIAEL